MIKTNIRKGSRKTAPMERAGRDGQGPHIVVTDHFRAAVAEHFLQTAQEVLSGYDQDRARRERSAASRQHDDAGISRPGLTREAALRETGWIVDQFVEAMRLAIRKMGGEARINHFARVTDFVLCGPMSRPDGGVREGPQLQGSVLFSALPSWLPVVSRQDKGLRSLHGHLQAGWRQLEQQWHAAQGVSPGAAAPHHVPEPAGLRTRRKKSGRGKTR